MARRLAVGVLGGEEPAGGRVGEVALHVGEDVARRVGKLFVTRDLVGFQVGDGELRLVVEHLLEVRDVPARVGRVAVKAAAQMIVDAARRHVTQRGEVHLQRVLALGRVRPVAGVNAGEQVERDGLRELRGVAEAAVLGVEAAGELLITGVKQSEAGRGLAGLGGGCRRERAQLGQYLVGLLDDFGAVLVPGVGYLRQDGFQSWLTAAVFRRKIGAAGEGFQFRGQENRHGPAAPAGRRLDEGHVGSVYVGALLAVHLDRDEAVVHQLCDGRVLEGFPLHDVAPVTGRITDRQEDGLVFLARLGEGFLAPRVPVDRVVRVLEQVGRFLVDQPVRVLRDRGGGTLSTEDRKREQHDTDEESRPGMEGSFEHGTNRKVGCRE